MTISPLRVPTCLLVTILLAAPVFAQTPGALSAEDRTAIQALVSSYAAALSGCKAEEFADLFVPDTGSFASGFRGQMVGRERLMALVQSERQCTNPPAAGAAPRPGGNGGPTVTIDTTSGGVRGIADLGNAGHYEDEYVKTARGWKFAARTVIIPAEKAAGLDAREMAAIQKLSANDVTDYYTPDSNGVKRLRTSGVAIGVTNGAVTGKAYLKAGGYYDDVYEKVSPGQWKIKSRTKVAATAP